jgi:hypothetical protein
MRRTADNQHKPPAAATPLLDALEEMARQHCFTERADHPLYPRRTDSSALGANATALQLLSDHGRFRETISAGRMVCGYWAEHDPDLQSKDPK